MEFPIADTFTDSLARPACDGSAVVTRRRTVNLRPLDSSAVSCCAHGPRKALWTLVNTASGLFSERIAGASGQTSLLFVVWLCYIGIWRVRPWCRESQMGNVGLQR